MKLKTFIVILIGFIVVLYINCHQMFESGFTLVPGDIGDTRTTIFIMEHWFNVIRNKEPFFYLGMFYPDKLALGYASAVFLLALPYSMFRAVGFDYFTAYQFMFIFMLSFGFLFWFIILKKVFKINIYFAGVGATILMSLNAMQLQHVHGQMWGIYMYPFLIYMLSLFVLQCGRKGRGICWSVIVFSAVFGLLFFTSYYIAWFFMFVFIVFSIVFLLLSIFSIVSLNDVFKRLYKIRFFLTIGLIVFSVALIPSFIIYWPMLKLGIKRSVEEVSWYMPRFFDVINVSNLNYLWSGFLDGFHFDYGKVMEVRMGLPLVAFCLFCVSFISSVVSFIRKRGTITGRELVFLSLSFTAISIWLMVCRQRNGDSFWYVIYNLVPGAAAIRAVGRFLIVFDIIAVIVVIYYLDKLYQVLEKSKKGRLFAVILLFVVSPILVIEEVNLSKFSLNKYGQMAFMKSFKRPDKSCSAFYIYDVPGGAFWKYSTDALLLSMKFHIPTVNGYTGYFPDGVFTRIQRGIGYRYRILLWLKSYGVHRICKLDYRRLRFYHVDVDTEYQKESGLFKKTLKKRQRRLLEIFSKMYIAAKSYIQTGGNLSNLYPEYLERHGFLDSSFGYGMGGARNWTSNRGWIGSWDCSCGRCFAIGVVGYIDDVRLVMNEYMHKAVEIYFPYPRHYGPDIKNGYGQLLMVFRIDR